ncbi:metallophosphoesterase 1-like [Danaus plexippus]|uniref:metallophosphoesterase 1-like n=1 Tax=Danaus plexippus TaxID=13037 RepID=UPI002AB28990|nr:metallophosphoesterase 1-like [Danaus plexippus]
MRRLTKNLLILLIGLGLIGFYCEFLIYYIVTLQCGWPNLTDQNEDVLKAFILSDPHLLGPFRGHWLDKWRREWQMHQSFQAIVKVHNPDVVFVLGDLFDEGEWTNNKQFKSYVDRFHNLFSLPDHIKMYAIVGNHDIGFHNRIRRGSAERFSKLLNAPSVQHIILKDNHFVLINSMALEGDSCDLCQKAQMSIDKIAERLDLCSKKSEQCSMNNTIVKYSKPVIMQHFPLFRKSDSICTEPDAPPLPERNKLFRPKIDALSKEATEYLVRQIKPRAVFGGHTHHGCLVQHLYKQYDDIEFLEYSVPSFSWRNRPDPKYLLVSITPNSYKTIKCALPTETTLALTAVILIVY